MSRLTEIQNAIEELEPEEKKELRECLDEHDSELEREWAKVAEERLRGIKLANGRLLMPLKCLRRYAV